MPPHPQPDVEQAHARLERELLRHQLVLGRLRLLERGRRRRVARARVGHRRPEHPLVEAVGHVVVVAIAFESRSLECSRPRGGRYSCGGGGWRCRSQIGSMRRASRSRSARPRSSNVSVGHGREQLVEVALHLDLAAHVRAGEPERARRRGEPRERPRRVDPQRQLGAVRSGLAAVVADHAHRDVRPDHAGNDLRDLHRAPLIRSPLRRDRAAARPGRSGPSPPGRRARCSAARTRPRRSGRSSTATCGRRDRRPGARSAGCAPAGRPGRSGTADQKPTLTYSSPAAIG